VTESEWETVRAPIRLIAARCKRCHHLVARYVGMPDDDGTPGHWEPAARRGCSCQPPPVLPEGEELAGLVARALEKYKSRSTPGIGLVDAVMTIRV
jgi:hypothetical protein